MNPHDFRFVRQTGLNRPVGFIVEPMLFSFDPVPEIYWIVRVKQLGRRGLLSSSSPWLDETEERIVKRAECNLDALRALVLHWKVQGIECELIPPRIAAT